ncbi:hypothetical protein CHU93_12490 [Sandarakinorhabdus cyanobacteriorum]|uniref:Sulfotransferase family protein n=1 Tax=Sandarakinorhabdus cyanobacteriorum TaxID=1981098 RepID=A0A255YA77_9SPHN|nr:hypothetical protein CHU93_12490 [Sandarakinorhabdus cyanobacteriorum]
MGKVSTIASDPLWLPHRYDPAQDAVHFRHTPRAAHGAATFLTDEYLGAATPRIVGRAAALAQAGPAAPLHFVLHSAFCCSTLLARAFDAPGLAMGLKEPVILNDLIGWQLRGGDGRQIAGVLDGALRLLERPFGPGEAVVIKPSNVCNAMAPLMLQFRPKSRALLLHAPLRVFLGSVARKGMDGRRWVRELLVKQLKQGLHGFGYSGEDYLQQTDLQIAAMGWLAQHALFARMAAQFGPQVRCLDSDQLLASPAAAMAALARLFDVPLDAEAIVAGPIFSRHSKFGQAFTSEDRAKERAAEAAHQEEIEKVAIWTDAVAKAAGVPLQLPQPLLG